MAVLIVIGDCSFESGRPSSADPVLTLLTLKRPFLVKELVVLVTVAPEFEVATVFWAELAVALVTANSVEILNRPFLVSELELDSPEPYPIEA